VTKNGFSQWLPLQLTAHFFWGEGGGMRVLQTTLVLITMNTHLVVSLL